MPDEITIGAGITSLLGLIYTIIQYTTPSLEDTLLGLTKDIIASSTDLGIPFKFTITALLNIAVMASAYAGLMAIAKGVSQ
jgi:hypothetical protein